jgi:hypothetical protein
VTHPTEDDLVLHFYREADAEVAAHLAECAHCRERLGGLETTLAAARADDVPTRDDGYGARVWERLAPRLAAEAQPRRRPILRLPSRAARRFGAVGAIAASLAVAFLLGRHLPRPETEPVTERVRERILLVAVGDHLERSQMVLVELVNSDAAGADVSAERHSAEQLVAANRLYRQTAARAGEAGVVAVLDQLERVLIEVANGPAVLGPAELRDIRRRIEAGGLLFRVRVIGSQVRERERDAGRDPSGRIS